MGRSASTASGIAGLLLLMSCSASPRGGEARGVPVSRVLLVGIDGADPLILDRLIAAGRLPTFSRLKREGAYGRLRSREPMLSPLLWTTIVTGRKPQDHGVLDFVEVGADGQPSPITSLRRRVPALWNIAAEFGRSAGFVGWYASFPAERTNGFQVSDRIAFHQVRSATATTGATFPEALAGELRESIGEAVPDLAATRARFVRASAAPLSPDGGRRLEQLARIHATTELYRRAVPLLDRRFHPDLLGVYFELIDACGHLFMEDAPPRRPEVAEADFQAFSETIDRCYEYQDEVLADVLKIADGGVTTLVLSDHGFKSGDARPRTSGRADTGLAPLWHRLYGVLFVSGPSARAGAEIRGAGLLDIAPTVLALLGIPPAKDLPGQPIEQAFAAGTLPATLRPIDHYAPAAPIKTPGSLPADREAVERLHALGYLSGPGASVAHDTTTRTAASYLNEGSARSADEDLDGALHAYEKAIELDPRNVNALAFAALIHIHRGQLEEARRLLDRALSVNPSSAWVRMQRANWALRSRDWPLAAREVQAAERIDDRLPAVQVLKARLAHATGQDDKAAEALARAESLTDTDALLGEISVLRGDIAAARGDFESAARVYRSAVAGRPGDSALQRKLGEALGGSKAFTESEAAFGKAVVLARTDEEKERAFGDLSLLFQTQKKDVQAIAVLERATAELPRSAVLWGMLGAAYGRTEQLDKALAAYERSVALRPTSLACKTLAALVFERRKDRSRALALWKQSLALDPNQADVRGFLRTYARP